MVRCAATTPARSRKAARGRRVLNPLNAPEVAWIHKRERSRVGFKRHIHECVPRESVARLIQPQKLAVEPKMEDEAALVQRQE